MLRPIIRKRICVLASFTFLLLVALFLLNVVRDRNLDHDEHQFIASAVLLVREGLLPYRDYPYFHVPNLLFLYAFLFRFSDYYLLTARLFTVFCEWLLMVTLFFVAWSRFGGHKAGKRFVLATGTVLLLLSNPLFLYTSGIAWNHALPVLLTVWAFLIHSKGLNHRSLAFSQTGWLFVSGLLVGGAVGTRLSFGLLILPFLLVIFLRNRDEGQDGEKVKGGREGRGKPWRYSDSFYKSLLFMSGLGVALLPTLWSASMAPQQFVFGTIEYAALNTLYREATNFGRAMTLGGKVNYLFTDVMFFERGGNFVFFLLFFLIVVWPIVGQVPHSRKRTVLGSALVIVSRKWQGEDKLVVTTSVVSWGPERLLSKLRAPSPLPQVRETMTIPLGSFRDHELAFLWLLLPFLLIGALVPTPTQLQYFYPLVPFILLIILYTLAPLPVPRQGQALPVPKQGQALPLPKQGQALPLPRQGQALPLPRFFVLGVILSLLTSNMPRYYNLLKLQKLGNWTPIELHERGEQVARLTNKQKVLTLAPIIPLEGGSPIYEAFATGPFAWRVTKFLPHRGTLRAPQDVRQIQGMVGYEELLALVADDPPRAILVGVEPDEAEEELPLVEYAQTHPYTALKLADDEILWLSSLADWGGAIRLAAVELPTKALAPGESFQVLFYLQNIAPIERNLNVLLRVISEDGQELLRDEGWPFGSATSAWPLKEIWRDGHELVIPQDALAGTYRVELTFYDPATFEHLPAINPHTGEALASPLVSSPPLLIGGGCFLMRITTE